MRARVVVLLAVLAVAVAGCGNASSDKKTENTTGGGSGTTVSAADRTKNVPVTAPGVTDKEIGVSVITTATNPIGGNYAEFGDGVQAYFDMVNAEGGIYGRQLKILKRRDDKFANQPEVKASLAEDNAFATFVATPLFGGAQDLADVNQPTFIWNINPEMNDKTNIFGTSAALCFNCISQALPYFALKQGFKKVGVLAYSVENSSECGRADIDSFKKYPSAEVVYSDLNLTFGQADFSAQVSAMKAAGVDMVVHCIDQKAAVVLGKEMQKQQLNAKQVLPNGYDAEYARENAQSLDGSFVYLQLLPLEYKPLIPEQQLLVDWVAKSKKQMRELTINGWIAANQFVTGLLAAGPEFSQQKVIDGLNSMTDFSANGMIVPIDWTRQHNDPKGKPEYEGKYQCFTGLVIKNGAFAPLEGVPADKPWMCMQGEPQGRAPNLTQQADFKSFAPPK